MGRTITQTPISRSMEFGVQIDIESDRALELMGIEDPQEFRGLLQDMSKGRRSWGPQGGHDGYSPQPDTPTNASSAEAHYDGEEPPEEIDGWPTDPERYTEDGSIIGEDRNGNGKEEIPGIVNGMDIRGMVPGGISGASVSRVPVPMPSDVAIHLNMP